MGDGFCQPRAEVYHGLSYGLSAYGGQMLYKRWAVNGTWFLQGHHSEQTNRTSPTQWMFVIKICGVLCEQFVFPSSSELRLFQCKKHRYLKQKKCHYMPMSAMAMSYQCTFAPVYPDSIDFLKGHTFHPHSATA